MLKFSIKLLFQHGHHKPTAVLNLFNKAYSGVGTCKMCILCSVLVALEAVEVIHMSDLYSFARIHIHRKEIWFIPRTPLYIYIYRFMICITEIIYTI